MEKNTRKDKSKKKTQRSQKSVEPKDSDKKVNNDIASRTREKKQHKQHKKIKIAEDKDTQKKEQKPVEKKKFSEEIGGKYIIQYFNPLGKGGSGEVYKACLKQFPDQVFACKIIRRSKIDQMNIYGNNINVREKLEAEMKTQKTLSECKYIAKLHDYISTQDGYYIFMELCSLDLNRYIQEKKGHLPEAEALDFFYQLLKGYKYLYDRGISHRDLKPENLLLNGKTLKISDFGLVKAGETIDNIIKSIQKGASLTGSCVGTAKYMAPEIYKIQNGDNRQYNPTQSDVWSMGLILYKMLFGRLPHENTSMLELLKKVQQQPLPIPNEPKISKKTTELLKQMIEINPAKRIKFNQLYFQEIKDEGETAAEKESPPSIIYSEKERIISFYNLMVTKISYDCAHYATLREIGIEPYQKYSAKLMTLIHEKNLKEIKNRKDINPDLLKQIDKYHQNFYEAVKETFQGSSFGTDLKTQLKLFKTQLQVYKDLKMLHKEVQYFLLLLLLLYNFETQNVTFEYINTILKEKSLSLKKVEELLKTNLSHK